LTGYAQPEGYELAALPTPSIKEPDEVLIKVHATSINPVDVKVASGMTKMMVTNTFPYKLGYDVSGTVLGVGSAVTSVKVGDEVYSRVDDAHRGVIAEYAVSTESTTTLKPASLDFAQAAAIPLAAMTALQSMDLAVAHFGSEGLKGKTVLIPAGLSGTGSIALQLAKNVFGAGKIITTLSTKKIDIAKKLFGDMPTIQYIDYTKENVLEVIGKGTVDYMFDIMGQMRALLPVMKRGGMIVSVTALPPGKTAKKFMPAMPVILVHVLNAMDWFYRWSASRYGVAYSWLGIVPKAKDLERLSQWVKEGKLMPVVGRTAKLSDIEEVRKGCQEVYDGKGGVGKFVIEII